MAQQKSILRLRGTIGGITFYKSKDGYMAREKGGVDADRIRKDPAFQRTRENCSEFGRAGKAAKALRNALRNMIQKASDSRVTSRLCAALFKVIQSDTTSPRGERMVALGDCKLLKGFEFNKYGKLDTSLYIPYEATMERSTGKMLVSFSKYVPSDMIMAPSGTTHYQLISGAAAIDFEANTFVYSGAEHPISALDSTESPALELESTLPADTTQPLFLVLGILFFQEVNGEMYSLKNGAFNGLQIIGTEV